MDILKYNCVTQDYDDDDASLLSFSFGYIWEVYCQEKLTGMAI
jgi:hypothetical protein